MRPLIFAALFGTVVFAQAPMQPQQPDVPAAQAQSSPFEAAGSSVIRGIVTDPSGAAVPNAKVTITEVERNVSHPAATDAAGRYAVTALPPGTYTLWVEAPGFKRYAHTGIHLAAERQTTFDVSLQVKGIFSTSVREQAFQRLQLLTETLAPGRPCAVPLKNVLPQGAPAAEPMKTFPPANPSRFPMREIPLPAPSCDDVKR
jgi:hypothetical protein